MVAGDYPEGGFCAAKQTEGKRCAVINQYIIACNAPEKNQRGGYGKGGPPSAQRKYQNQRGYKQRGKADRQEYPLLRHQMPERLAACLKLHKLDTNYEKNNAAPQGGAPQEMLADTL